MDIYITEKESGTRIALSMLPEKVKRKASTKFQSYDIINIGEVKLPRGTKLLTFSWDGTFPGAGRKSYGFIVEYFAEALDFRTNADSEKTLKEFYADL